MDNDRRTVCPTISIASMTNSAGFSKEACKSAIAFLLEFGSDWIDDEKVQSYIFNHQTEAEWFHVLLEIKIDLIKPIKGVTHRRLKPEVLLQILEYTSESNE